MQILYVPAVSLFWIYPEFASANADQPESGVEREPASNTIDRSLACNSPFLLCYDPEIHVHALLAMPTAVWNILQGAIMELSALPRLLHTEWSSWCAPYCTGQGSVVGCIFIGAKCQAATTPTWLLFFHSLPFLKDTTQVPCCAI